MRPNEVGSGSMPAPRRARVAAANGFLALAFVLKLVFAPLTFKYYLRFSVGGVVLNELLMALVVVGVTLSLLEGVRGVRQRRTGGLVAIVLAIIWLLVHLLSLYLRLAVVPIPFR